MPDSLLLEWGGRGPTGSPTPGGARVLQDLGPTIFTDSRSSACQMLEVQVEHHVWMEPAFRFG